MYIYRKTNRQTWIPKTLIVYCVSVLVINKTTPPNPNSGFDVSSGFVVELTTDVEVDVLGNDSAVDKAGVNPKDGVLEAVDDATPKPKETAEN